MASEISYEEAMGLPPKQEKAPVELQVAPEPDAPLPSYEELTGRPKSARGHGARIKAGEDDFNTPVYLANKAKLGMATVLSLGGLGFDFLNELQYMSYDMFGIDVHNKFLDTTRKPIFYGFEETKKGYEKILFADFDIEEPKDLGTRTMGTIAEFGGASIFSSGSLVGRAGSTVDKTAGLSERMIKQVLPKVSVAATETASVVSAGVAYEVAGQLAEGTRFEDSARLGGSILGGMAPYTLPAALSPVISRISNWLKPATQASIGRQKAAELIKRELADVEDYMTALEESARLKKNIPGFTPSLGAETDAAGLLSLEKRFAQNSVRGYELSRQADIKSLRAIQNRMDDAFPKSNYNLSTIPEERLLTVRDSMKSEMAMLDDQMKTLEQTITSGRAESPAKIGEQLRTLRNAKEDTAREIKNTLYEQFFRAADDSNITVNPETIRDTAVKILGDEGITFQKKSPVLKQIMSRYFNLNVDDIADGQTLSQALAKQGGGKPGALVDPNATPRLLSEDNISMREFHSMYRAINREIGVARQGMKSGNTEAGALYYQLGQMKREFAKNLDDLKASEYGVVADKLKQADDFYINDYQTVFRQGLGGRMDNYGRFGEITDAEDIVSNLVMGRESGIDDFYKLYGESQEAQALLENGVLDMFSRAAVKRGKYNPTDAANFMDKYDSVLSKMPDMNRLLGNQERTYQALLNRNLQLNNKLKAIQKGKLQKITGMHNTEEVINKAMKKQDSLLALRRSVEQKGGEEGMKAFRHGVAEHLMSKADPFEYFLENEGKMRVAFKNSKHFQDLRDLAQARRILSNKHPVQQVDTTLVAEDPLKKLIGTSAVEAMTMARWVNAGRLSPEYVISQMSSRGVLKFRQEAMNKAMEEALYSPQTAKTLLEFAETQGKIKPLSSRPGSWGKSDFTEKLKDIFFSLGVRNTAATASAAAPPTEDLLED